MFYKRTVIVEEVKVWEECGRCRGTGAMNASRLPGNCSTCNGKGGKWHEDTFLCRQCDGSRVILVEYTHLIVTKSSTLIREHEVCKDCGGSKVCMRPKHKCFHSNLAIRCEDSDGVECLIKDLGCPHCHGTGAEPDTATPWRVKEE